jgi:putative spermidine/putrescine transport system permease protein
MDKSVNKAEGANLMAKRIFYIVLGAIIVLPAVILVLIEYVYPFFLSFLSSLKADGAYSLKNYRYVFDFYLLDIFYTVAISAAALVCVLIISISVGGYLTLHTNRIIEFFFKIPLFIPFVVVGHAMRTFLAPKGLLNSMLSQINLVDLNSPPEFAYGFVGTVIALTWKQMAFALLLVMGAFRSVDKSYLEAAKNLGASTFKQIKDILLPLSLGSIGVSAILIFTSFLQNFSVVMMMGKGDGPQHLMIDIYHRITYLNDLGVANALGVISYLLALGAAIIYLKRVMKKDV